MANLKSSRKKARQNTKHHAINLARKSSIKTTVKKVVDAINKKDIEQAQKFLKEAQAKFARAKSKKLLHPNNAARKVSRLAKKVAALSKSA